MADIRIKDLPPEVVPVGSERLALDGSSTRSATITAIVEAGRPTASQAEAEAGTQPTNAMTPLTTKQAIDVFAVPFTAIGTTIQPYSTNLDALSVITPQAAGASILAMSLGADVRNFLDTAPYVATRSAMKDLNPVLDKVAILTEGVPARWGRFGNFAAVAGSPPVSDPFEFIYVISNTPGWYYARMFNDGGPINICWGGGNGNDSADNSPVHAAAVALSIALTTNNTVIYYPTGKYRFNSSVNGFRSTAGNSIITFLGDGFDNTFILSNYYDAGSVMWDFIDPALATAVTAPEIAATSRVGETNFIGLQFGSVSRTGGVNPRYLRIHGWGNSEIREVKFGPSNNTWFSAGGMQNIKMDRVEGWYGGKSWVWTDATSVAFSISGTGLITATGGTPFLSSDASSNQYITLNHSAARRRYRIAVGGYVSSTQVQAETTGFRLGSSTAVTGWFGSGLVTGTAASNQFAYPSGRTGPFTSADVGRVVLIKQAAQGTYLASDFAVLRGIIKSVTNDRTFTLGDEHGHDIVAYRNVTDATMATPCFDFYQITFGSSGLLAGSSHVEITKLHLEHFWGVGMWVDNADAWYIQGKLHGEVGTTPGVSIQTNNSVAGLWVNDFGGVFQGILDSSVSSGSERVYVCDTNKTFTLSAFSRNTINEVQLRVEASNEIAGRVNVTSLEMANYYASTMGWLVDNNGPDKTAIGYIAFDDGSTPVRRAITSNRGDESNELALTSTITWNGTPPSNPTALRYRWRQVGDIVFFAMRLEYATPGATNSQLDIAVPADMPRPAVLTGTSSNEMATAIEGFMSAGFLSAPSLSKTFLKDDNAGGYVFRTMLNTSSVSADFAIIKGWYFTDAV